MARSHKSRSSQNSRRAKRGHQGAFIFGILIGALAGAAAALFLTPRSGRQIRADLAARGSELQSRLDDAAAGVRSQSQSLVGPYVEKVAETTWTRTGARGDQEIAPVAAQMADEPARWATAGTSASSAQAAADHASTAPVSGPASPATGGTTAATAEGSDPSA